MTGPGWSGPALDIFGDLLSERYRQLQKWGPQQHPDGTGGTLSDITADAYRAECEANFAAGVGTWRHILLEEVYEALAESERDALRKELVQVATVAVAWIEDLDNRAGDRAEVPEPEPVLQEAA